MKVRLQAEVVVELTEEELKKIQPDPGAILDLLTVEKSTSFTAQLVLLDGIVTGPRSVEGEITPRSGPNSQ